MSIITKRRCNSEIKFKNALKAFDEQIVIMKSLIATMDVVIAINNETLNFKSE